jgi:OPA family glycerol-3-phosphate transporter-like MFS transporter
MGQDMTDGQPRLQRWQGLTLGLMFAGYTGYYLCRSNLAVTQPEIARELVAGGLSEAIAKEKLGAMVSLGTLAYAFGKLLGGGIGDAAGGRRFVLLGMVGAVGCTLLFASGGGLPVFTIAWIGNRFIQSFGWLGMVKITSRWFSFASYGSAMGFLSLSFLFGDAANRLFLGWLLGHHLGWRAVFVVSASILLGLFVACLFLLRESPGQLGLPEPGANPLNVYGKTAAGTKPNEVWSLLGPLFRSPMFLLVCLLSAGLTLIRETFNAWTPTYFDKDLHLGPSTAARLSSLFPLLGGVSVLIVGVLSDRLGRVGRAAIICGGMFLAGAALAVLGRMSVGGSVPARVGLVALIGFLLIGPYSFLAGAIALDLGGKRGSAIASGLIDGLGYIVGGTLAGKMMAEISTKHGWQGAFTVLAGVAWLSSLVAGVFLFDQWRVGRRYASIGAGVE